MLCHLSFVSFSIDQFKLLPQLMFSFISRFGTEERFGGFPFVFNQQFKLAIAFDERKFLIGLNGHHFCDFQYRDTDILKSLAGFKITCLNGLRMHVTGVDHLRLHNTTISSNYFKYSRLDYECA